MAQAAEGVGIDTLWVADHLLFRNAGSVAMDEGETRGVWEAFTVLSAIAEATSRATIGPFVTCNSFRNPALLAKIADTLDDVSDGRLLLGLGAGWHEPEYTAFGYPFDHLASRFDEALQIIVPLLKGEEITFSDRKSTRLNSSHANISYAVFCLKKKKKKTINTSITNITLTRNNLVYIYIHNA